MHINNSESTQSDAGARLQFASHQFYNAFNLLVALLQVLL